MNAATLAKPGKMHAARTLTPILARVLAVLQRGPATTSTIIHEADCCAVNSHVSALRRLGYDIACKPIHGLNGARPHVYTLASAGQMALWGAGV